MDNRPQGERVMHKAGDADGCTGGWKCSSCNTAINELPFKPNPNYSSGLLCRDCFKNRPPKR